ncbi:SprT-like domain-containing protein [Acinetobacter baumannii]|nr:SprT-like domain-containing protein [Acinetobacter baumannii]
MTTNKPTPELYEALQQAYDAFNHALFNGKLDNSLITLQRQANTYGYMSYNRFISTGNKDAYTHELALNPEYFGVKPLVEVLQTMVHEMCHLWQWQYGTPSQKSYHNREWAEKMESIGLMPSDTGRVGGKKTGQKMADYPIVGGRFLAVSNELHSRGVIVAWYDRFKPKHTSIQSMINDKNFAEMQSFNVVDGLLTIPHLPENTEISIANIFGQNPEEPGLFQDKDLDKPIKEKPVSSKNKFTCSCGVNLWGKATLKVTCKICNTDFVMV